MTSGEQEEIHPDEGSEDESTARLWADLRTGPGHFFRHGGFVTTTGKNKAEGRIGKRYGQRPGEEG